VRSGARSIDAFAVDRDVLNILHISDVHFGPPHVPALSNEILAFAERRQPDLVVISGDLTQRAKPVQFREARRFVDGFLQPTIVVPGNHDVPLYRVWERFLAPFGAYRRHFQKELEPVVRGRRFIAVGINTAHGLTFTEGRIRKSRLREVATLLRGVPDSLVKMVVAHHHLVPPPRFGSQKVLTNAFEAIDVFSRAGVDLILSGHHHQSFIANSEDFYPKGRPPVVILHSGTTTSNRGRGSERDKNTCFWIEVGEKSMAIGQLRWESGLGTFAEHSRHLYPRQECDPYILETPPLPGSELAG
jgi:3',5'-cyclic AMP phosphodiesterase CpdA